MQWQHGRYEIADNGSLILYPIVMDGRQLLSDPCKYSNSIYTRFNTTEIYKVYTSQLHRIYLGWTKEYTDNVLGMGDSY